MWRSGLPTREHASEAHNLRERARSQSRVELYGVPCLMRWSSPSPRRSPGRFSRPPTAEGPRRLGQAFLDVDADAQIVVASVVRFGDVVDVGGQHLVGDLGQVLADRGHQPGTRP